MKTLVAIILALGVGFAAAYFVISKQKPVAAPQVQSEPPTAAKTPASTPQVIVKSVPAAATAESPQDILNDLLNLDMGTTGSERNTALRTVIFKLECLAHIGADAVPAIREFIGRSVDVNYNQQDTQNNNQGGGNNGNGFGNFRGARRARNLKNLQTDWVIPPSLRLGLVGTLKEIGDKDAEQALAEMLGSTARGVEVAYLTVVLEEIAPGKYKDEAIKAAKDLLTHPVTIDSPDRLDDLSKSYLYGVLEFYSDTSFVPTAEQMLVGADGRLDQDAMDYLSTVLKDQSVSALYAAYNNPALTNQFDKMSLGRDILNFAGQNPQANQLFTDTLNNPDLNDRMKIFAIAQLDGGFGGNVPTDPQIINQKIAFLQSIEGQFPNNPALSQVFPQVIKAMQNGTEINPRDLFGGNNGGGGRRNRGGFGGGGNGGN